MNSIDDLRNISENFGAKVLNNFNVVKRALRECMHLNFMPIKFKECLTELLSEGLPFNKTVTICVSFG
jgi:hypothetical protein